MDLHPIFVHFPIALLTAYSVVELFSFWRAGRSSSVFQIKAFLVIVGTFMGIFTIVTGLMAEEKFEGSDMERLVSTHEFFAITTIVLYLVLAGAYLVRFLSVQGVRLPDMLRRIADTLLHPVTSKVLALVTLCTLTIVGALGGAIVYGPESDPAVKFIYNLLIGTAY